MSSPTSSGSKMSKADGGTQDQAVAPSRLDRRRDWWTKNKEFKSKLRDRTTLSKKENSEQSPTVLPKVESSRGFRSSVATKLAAAASKQKTTHPTHTKISPQSKQKTSPKLNSKPPTRQGAVVKKKPKVVPKPVPAAAKPKAEEGVQPEMISEISMNARGVGMASGGNHVPQRYILFIGNLPYTIDKGQLMSHFRKTGGVKSIRIPKSKEGIPKGFAYVEFKDRISHGIALRLHHTTLGGRRINVEFSTSESKKKDPDSSHEN